MISDAKPQDSTQCNFCHDIEILRTDALNTPTHVKPKHQEKKIFDDCLNCHRGFSVKVFTTVDSLHYNGRIDTISAAKCNECHSEPHVF
jgi:nitrate/TMAO reductase-like tetraheme cytochrome c subunit